MPRRQDDEIAWRAAATGRNRPVTGRERGADVRSRPAPRPSAGRPAPARTSTTTWLLLGTGFVLALVATLAVFVTDNPQYLRIAVVAVAWAFVLATFAAGRRGGDKDGATAREAELRRAYERELEREVAARREYELELENELRRETEGAMRSELDALRGELHELSGLREEVARVSAMRADLAALGGLRDEVARVSALRDQVEQVAALRDDVAALAALRQELGQLAELRADMGQLRAELTEQLSSEMLVERIVMRTQASRLPADPSSRTLESGSGWTEDALPRELTGGWPAVRLGESPETRQAEQVRAERSAPPPPAPPTAAFPLPTPTPPSPTWQSEPRPWEPTARPPWDPEPRYAEPGSWESAAGGRHSGSAAPDEDTPLFGSIASSVPPPPSPLDWLASRSLLDAEPGPSRPEVPPRRRRSDDVTAPPPLPTELTATTERAAALPPRPAPQPQSQPRPQPRPEVTPARDEAADRPASAPNPALAKLLADNGVDPSATGGRRRRRYRDEGDSDDVLSRVLGRS